MSRRESWASIAAKLDGTECAEELRVELELAVTRIEELEARLSAPVDEDALREAIRLAIDDTRGLASDNVLAVLRAVGATKAIHIASAEGRGVSEQSRLAAVQALREAGLLRPEVER